MRDSRFWCPVTLAIVSNGMPQRRMYMMEVALGTNRVKYKLYLRLAIVS